MRRLTPASRVDIDFRYTKTTILKPQVIEILASKGIEFSETADCTTAVLRIACDKSINGMFFPFSLAGSLHYSLTLPMDGHSGSLPVY